VTLLSRLPLATYYYQNGNAGACGAYHSDSDKIIAINGAGYWSNYESGGVSPYCGKWITIKTTDGSGRSTQAMVADVCPTCTGSTNSLDLSVGAFEDLGTLSQGQIDIEWSFNN
jgi:expansin (peptidoglycan-binding protein)